MFYAFVSIVIYMNGLTSLVIWAK